jgi:hypothetical protein
MDHCIDMLRQSLMCYADMTPLISYDDKEQGNHDYPFPDFASQHKCRDFGKLVDWSYTNPRALKWGKFELWNRTEKGRLGSGT